MHNSNTPINQYSLKALEKWLINLGSNNDSEDPSKWYLSLSNLDATIIFEQDYLSVVMDSDGSFTKRSFSYCINLEDVENAILQGS